MQPTVNTTSAAAVAAVAAAATSTGLADRSASMVAIAGMVRWTCSFTVATEFYAQLTCILITLQSHNSLL